MQQNRFLGDTLPSAEDVITFILVHPRWEFFGVLFECANLERKERIKGKRDLILWVLQHQLDRLLKALSIVYEEDPKLTQSLHGLAEYLENNREAFQL